MPRKDIHTNIMLDLECASAEHCNPVILEIAAVHFNLDTGAEINSFSTLISYQSCIDHGLVENAVTLDWLKENIPKTLEKTKSCDTTLPQALYKLSCFIRAACKVTQDESKKRIGRALDNSQPMIWGNGAVADNCWIKNAYLACDMQRPWKYYNDRCVRTIADECLSITGRDFKQKEIFVGLKHVALNDCRYQIKYLVKARNALAGRSEVLAPVLSGSNAGERPVQHRAPVSSESSLHPRGQLRRKRDDETHSLEFPARNPGLPSPDQSFVETEPQKDLDLAHASLVVPQGPIPRNGLISPENSFSHDFEQEEPESSPAFETMATPPNAKRQRLPHSPDVSFCANGGNQITTATADIKAVISLDNAICAPNEENLGKETDESNLPKQELPTQQVTEERTQDKLEPQQERSLEIVPPSFPLNTQETTKPMDFSDGHFPKKESILAAIEQKPTTHLTQTGLSNKVDQIPQERILGELDFREEGMHHTRSIAEDKSAVIKCCISEEDEQAVHEAEFEQRTDGDDFSIEDMDDEDIPDSFWRGRSRSRSR